MPSFLFGRKAIVAGESEGTRLAEPVDKPASAEIIPRNKKAPASEDVGAPESISNLLNLLQIPSDFSALGPYLTARPRKSSSPGLAN
jgi:hypothetical protein